MSWSWWESHGLQIVLRQEHNAALHVKVYGVWIRIRGLRVGLHKYGSVDKEGEEDVTSPRTLRIISIVEVDAPERPPSRLGME